MIKSKKLTRLPAEIEPKTKNTFLSFDELRIQKNSLLEIVFPEILDSDYVVYDTLFKNLNILKDVCALANSNGGSVFIGVKNNKCQGVICANRQSWLDHMIKISRFMWTTLHTVDNKKIKYSIKNFVVYTEGSPIECFMSQIVIKKSPEQCLINSYNAISSYIRQEGQTIDMPLSEEIMLKTVVTDEHSTAEIDVGDVYGGEEGEMLEFKPSLCFLKTKEGIGKYFSSFGNTNGGEIIIGVNDEGKICGIKIENNQEWDSIKQDVLRLQHHINNVDFLSQIKMDRIPLKKKYHFLVKIIIPKNTDSEPILVRDKQGVWNKWKRVLSCSINDDRTSLYTSTEYAEMQNNYLIEKTKYEQTLKEFEQLKYKNNEIHIQIEKEKEDQKRIIEEITKNSIKKYIEIKKQTENSISFKNVFALFGFFIFLSFRSIV